MSFEFYEIVKIQKFPFDRSLEGQYGFIDSLPEDKNQKDFLGFHLPSLGESFIASDDQVQSIGIILNWDISVRVADISEGEGGFIIVSFDPLAC